MARSVGAEKSVKVTTSFQALMRLAAEQGRAKKELLRLRDLKDSWDGGQYDALYAAAQMKFQQAYDAHESYRQLCLKADEVLTGLTYADL